ncbi:MAG: hypothetical protein HFI72_05050 [Peptococcaceae bacterium]|nr:hypothetical protein [Peptococcaceae bacterium]
MMLLYEEDGVFNPTDFGLKVGDIIQVVGIGGGGAGGGGYKIPAAGESSGFYNQGGNSGEYKKSFLKLLSLNPISVEIGQGGIGNARLPGSNGGDTKFGSYFTARGGSGGDCATDVGTWKGGKPDKNNTGGGGAGGFIPGVEFMGGDGLLSKIATGAPNFNTRILNSMAGMSGVTDGTLNPHRYASKYGGICGQNGCSPGGGKAANENTYCGGGGGGYGAGGGASGGSTSNEGTAILPGGNGADGVLLLFF